MGPRWPSAFRELPHAATNGHFPARSLRHSGVGFSQKPANESSMYSVAWCLVFCPRGASTQMRTKSTSIVLDSSMISLLPRIQRLGRPPVTLGWFAWQVLGRQATVASESDHLVARSQPTLTSLNWYANLTENSKGNLQGRAANRCAICRKELVMDATETDDESLVGEACHIVAQSIDGPRGPSPLTAPQRDKYANLILLCNIHHKQVDDQFNTYTVSKLEALKAQHESWVRTQLGFDAQKQRYDEHFVGYIEEWERRLNLDDWKMWASGIMCHGLPQLDHDRKVALEELRPWLLPCNVATSLSRTGSGPHELSFGYSRLLSRIQPAR